MKMRNRIFCIMLLVLLFSVTTRITVYAAQPDDASDFVLLSEVIPDAILEIRYYSTYNFVGERITGYEEPLALLTREAAEALREVSDELIEKGYRLKIYDAYRPQCAVDHFVKWARDTSDTRMKPYFYPDLDKSVLFEQSYISSKSGHSRGSTVDLTLFDMSSGKEVDMGGAFDYFGNRSHPDYTGITSEQYANRMLLRETMVSHGFKPLASEWWHFTLKSEPYSNTYFTFPIRKDILPHSDKQTKASSPAQAEIFLRPGMKGEAVQYYQKKLIAAGYLSGSADGSYGAKTESAVKQFQLAHNLEPTGIITKIEADLLSAIQ